MTATVYSYLLVTLSDTWGGTKRDTVTFFYFEGRPKLTRTDTITANAFFDEISSYRFGEPNHRSLGGTVDTPVHNACRGNTHTSLTHRHTRALSHAHKAIIWGKRITLNMVILQWLNVTLIGCNIYFTTKYSEKICGISFTFYAWCNRCHVNNVPRLLCKHLEWEKK